MHPHMHAGATDARLAPKDLFALPQKTALPYVESAAVPRPCVLTSRPLIKQIGETHVVKRLRYAPCWMSLRILKSNGSACALHFFFNSSWHLRNQSRVLCVRASVSEVRCRQTHTCLVTCFKITCRSESCENYEFLINHFHSGRKNTPAKCRHMFPQQHATAEDYDALPCTSHACETDAGEVVTTRIPASPRSWNPSSPTCRHPGSVAAF